MTGICQAGIAVCGVNMTVKYYWKSCVLTARKDDQALASTQAEAEQRADGILQRRKKHGLATKVQQDVEAGGCYCPEGGKPCLMPHGLGKHWLPQHGIKVLVRERLCKFTCRRSDNWL